MTTFYYTPMVSQNSSEQNFPITIEFIEKKSRFITDLFRIARRDEAEAFLHKIRILHPNATHHCFAWAVGNPNKSVSSHCSDDGEPSGTAGRPILSVLVGGGYGDTLIVVTRYFGGIKLGTGGLVRAYSTAARRIVEQTEYVKCFEKCSLQISFAYSFEREIRYICTQLGGEICQQEYQSEVFFSIEVEKNVEEELRHRLVETTAGRIEIKKE